QPLSRQRRGDPERTGVARPFFIGSNRPAHSPYWRHDCPVAAVHADGKPPDRTTSALRTLSLARVLSCPTLASAQVYKCVDGEGRITYTNDRSLGRSCQPLPQNQAVSTVPGPAQRATPAAPARAPAATSGGFPRVSQEDQRARDDTRRQVLHNELASEQAALEEAQK